MRLVELRLYCNTWCNFAANVTKTHVFAAVSWWLWNNNEAIIIDLVITSQSFHMTYGHLFNLYLFFNSHVCGSASFHSNSNSERIEEVALMWVWCFMIMKTQTSLDHLEKILASPQSMNENKKSCPSWESFPAVGEGRETVCIIVAHRLDIHWKKRSPGFVLIRTTNKLFLRCPSRAHKIIINSSKKSFYEHFLGLLNGHFFRNEKTRREEVCRQRARELKFLCSKLSEEWIEKISLSSWQFCLSSHQHISGPLMNLKERIELNENWDCLLCSCFLNAGILINEVDGDIEMNGRKGCLSILSLTSFCGDQLKLHPTKFTIYVELFSFLFRWWCKTNKNGKRKGRKDCAMIGAAVSIRLTAASNLIWIIRKMKRNNGQWGKKKSDSQFEEK